MERLPLEILEKILTDPKLEAEDVLNVSSTCHFLRNRIVSSNEIWKFHFFDTWPSLKEVFKTQPHPICFYHEIQYIVRLKQKTRDLLETMPPRFYKKLELSDSDLIEWDELISDQRGLNYYYLVLDLMEIVNNHIPIMSIEMVPLSTPGNKTMQYYAGKVLRFIRQLRLTKLWNDYISLPPRRQIMEIGAVIVAQWCQPDVEVPLEEISLKLDEIANKVRKRLFESYPKHSLFKVEKSRLDLWRIENLLENQFNVYESRQLIGVIREEIFIRMGFSGNNQAYYMPQNSFINEVLENKQGLPITLSIVFEAVARRVGLKCDPISFPAHFLLRFIESNERDSDWYYIDVFNGRKVVRRGACSHSRLSETTQMFPTATAVQVVERMANNLEVSSRQHTHPNGRLVRVRSSLELLKLVNPQDLSALLSLARLYMLHNMDTKPLILFLLSQEFHVPDHARRVVHMLRDYEAHQPYEAEIFPQIKAARRTEDLKFAVGMVMTHLAFNYKCVIYDWDLVCLADHEWQIQNNVDKLQLQDKQPFYNVLVEDGSRRYVAQENLRPTENTGFLYLNDEVGRHFSHFFETHYVPNAEKEKEYPGDKKIRHMFYQQMKIDHTMQVE